MASKEIRKGISTQQKTSVGEESVLWRISLSITYLQRTDSLPKQFTCVSQTLLKAHCVHSSGNKAF